MNTRLPLCTFYLTRHGETDWNLNKRVLGQSLRPHLTATGRQQAKAIAKKLAKTKLQAVYTSDLPRTIQTAWIIIGLRNLVITPLKQLRERDYGHWTGKSAKTYERDVTHKTQERERLSGKKRWVFKLAPDVESDAQVFRRVNRQLVQIARAHRGANVLVVTHGGCLRTFLVGNNFAKHHDLPKDKLLFGDYIKVYSDGTKFFLKKKPTGKVG